ncbi:winged helix-turn-helix transcriptional regulator [Natronosalvus vescus]|uniref:winged helix-turn-helix transcriptional regulator n=1 Tax=Natronosalvus vescus TaxID=2953881 RepID=UPI002091A242|nr:winged helix-turn-helix transcriptional regulator [Natronosalvus vescus]
MSETRRRIYRAITADPGVHFNALVRDLSLAPGQIQYHVRRLIEGGAIVRHERFGRTHYFAPSYDEWERDALSILRRETAAAITTALYSKESARPNELVETLGIPRSTLEHHVGHLRECGVVERRYERGNRVVLSLTRPAETVALLETVDPHPGSRLVDRLERLVDSLLEG